MLDYVRKPPVIYKRPYKRREGCERVTEGDVTTEAESDFFELIFLNMITGWGLGAEECRCPPEAGKAKETDPPMEPPEGTSPVDTLDLALQDPF